MGTCDTQVVTTFDWVVHFGCKLVQNDPRIEAVPMDAPTTKSAAVLGACLAIFCSDVLPAWPGPGGGVHVFQCGAIGGLPSRTARAQAPAALCQITSTAAGSDSGL